MVYNNFMKQNTRHQSEGGQDNIPDKNQQNIFTKILCAIKLNLFTNMQLYMYTMLMGYL